ncbi:hypothetical protein G7007_10910 [Pseudomonas entomophila]|uniref:phage virion morphogenesis protein n=1 Tax=Pseudomonas entomophila TaxID=312306 RepID=UPI0015E3F333|nr:phage virion morphogenesis protein [Pseudomonas entomophila]MBA1193371.1 hypothetical protein [Pseudomonas entomophila]
MKARGDTAGATVGFTGQVARITKVHQQGWRDRAQRGAPPVEYARRMLLGFTDQELETIRNTLLNHLSIWGCRVCYPPLALAVVRHPSANITADLQARPSGQA